MNFGLLCDDPAAAPLVSALQQHPIHRLTLAVLVSPRADELAALATGVRCIEEWEELLASTEIDAVIIGGTAPNIWDGARQLASAGIPLLVFPNLAVGETVLYELSLIRDDRQVVLLPAWTHRFNVVIQQLRADWQTENRPQISYLEWERGVTPDESGMLTDRAIDDLLLRDADLLRFLCGEVDQVTSLRLGETAQGTAMQTVKLSGRNFPETTWSIKPTSEISSRMTFQTSAGPLRLDWQADRQSCQRSDQAEAPANSPEVQLLESFAKTAAEGVKNAGWNDVLKALEIVDAARRSLTRRRTIDLHHELLSERAIFKTQMAAMGCGVLLLTLVLMLGYLGLASVAPLSGWILKLLRVLVFAPLFVFLLLQFLLPLTRPAK
jgi:predicted dehydrogenase